MSAHLAATSPYGPRASTAVQEHTNEYDGEAIDGFIQKYSLRRGIRRYVFHSPHLDHY